MEDHDGSHGIQSISMVESFGNREGNAGAEAETLSGRKSEVEKKSAWADYDTVFTNAKAGMEGVDKEHVKKVVYEMSKGSAFFVNQQRKEASLQSKVAAMTAARDKLTPTRLVALAKEADRKVAELESSRDLSHTWLHVDMDAFFAAVEVLCDPERLKGRPMAVGGTSMICTASYEARKFGVRAAMPGFIARRLCPDLIFVPPDFTKYQHFADKAREVFRRYDPSFSCGGLDEAHLNITQACIERDMSPRELAEELRSAVFEATGGLTCSAGIAANRMLAKVCSDINKPNGLFELPSNREAIMQFVASLPIRKVGGIGTVSERILKDVLSVTSCGDFLTHRAHLMALFSPISCDFFLSIALGIGGSEEVVHEPRKSISCERTFSSLSDPAAIRQKLECIAASLVADMRAHGAQARTITLKLKTTGFQVRTRAISTEHPLTSLDDIMPLALRLLRAELPVSVRLIGLRASNLSDTSRGTATSSARQVTLERLLPQVGPTVGEHLGTVTPDIRASSEGEGKSSEERRGEEPQQKRRGEQRRLREVERGRGSEEEERDWCVGDAGNGGYGGTFLNRERDGDAPHESNDAAQCAHTLADRDDCRESNENGESAGSDGGDDVRCTHGELEEEFKDLEEGRDYGQDLKPRKGSHCRLPPRWNEQCPPGKHVSCGV